MSLSETKSELEILSSKVEKAANELKNVEEDDHATVYNTKMEVSTIENFYYETHACFDSRSCHVPRLKFQIPKRSSRSCWVSWRRCRQASVRAAKMTCQIFCNKSKHSPITLAYVIYFPYLEISFKPLTFCELVCYWREQKTPRKRREEKTTRTWSQETRGGRKS